jgi:hypothetical protein
LDEYACYLRQERALSPRTLIYYMDFARGFLGRLSRWRMRLIARDSIQRALEEYERHQPWVLGRVSREHAEYLILLRDQHLKAKASWSGSSGSKKGGGSLRIILIVVAIQVVLAVLRDCQGQH